MAAAACVLVSAVSAQAADGIIAVYVDDAGTQCEGNIGVPVTTGSVWMTLAGATAGGITAAEFRIDNSDNSAYSISFAPDPACNAALGNAFLGGVTMAFPACQTGTGGRVKLGQLTIIENSHSADVSMTVRQHYTPSNPNYSCALAVLCDEPVYTSVCIGAPNSDHWRAVLNPSDGVSGDCEPVAVEPTSWSQLKALYTN
jgi:hypothetical protein